MVLRDTDHMTASMAGALTFSRACSKVPDYVFRVFNANT